MSKPEREEKALPQEAPLVPGHPEDLPEPGGLYRHVRMSVRSANRLILIGLAVLVFVTLFLIRYNGFTVTFNTAGGTPVVTQRVLYGERLPVTEPPVREGYRFTGWYRDPSATVRWDSDKDTVTESLTLYAGWAKKPRVE